MPTFIAGTRGYVWGEWRSGDKPDGKQIGHGRFQDLGAFYYERSNYSEAVRALTKAVELVPDYSDPHFALASACQDWGRFADAEDSARTSHGSRARPWCRRRVSPAPGWNAAFANMGTLSALGGQSHARMASGD